jgi:hypothetical protein
MKRKLPWHSAWGGDAADGWPIGNRNGYTTYVGNNVGAVATAMRPADPHYL